MNTATLVEAELLCLACGRGKTVTVAALADLPPRAPCPVCGGSTLVTGWSSRTVRDDAPFDWDADRRKVGRPRAHAKGGNQAALL